MVIVIWIWIIIYNYIGKIPFQLQVTRSPTKYLEQYPIFSSCIVIVNRLIDITFLLDALCRSDSAISTTVCGVENGIPFSPPNLTPFVSFSRGICGF